MPVDDHTKVLGYSTLGTRKLRVLITVDGENDNGVVTKQRLGSDIRWTHHSGPSVFDHLFLGEVVDGRRETPGWRESNFDDSDWDHVTIDPMSPTHPLVALAIPPIRRVAQHTATRMYETAPGSYVFDFNQNMAGMCTIRVDETSIARPGDTMTVLHAEGVDTQGMLLQGWLLGGASENNSYTFRADGTQEIFESKFAYFGFRFVEVTGFPGVPTLDAITCDFVHTDLERDSSIFFVADDDDNNNNNNNNNGGTSESDVLNGVQQLILYSALSNYMSHPTDCPSREKRGWTGDGGHAAETLMFNFGMAAPYAKWLDDIAAASVCCGGSGDGAIPEIAPLFFGLHGESASDPAWGAGFIDLLDWHYRYHGDLQSVQRHYKTGMKYVSYLSTFVSNATGGLLTTSYPTTRYGDWCAPNTMNSTTANITATGAKHTSNIINGFFWIRQLQIMEEMATLLGMNSDASTLHARVSIATKSFVSRYFDQSLGVFQDPFWQPANGPEIFQTEQALSLTLGLLNEDDTARVVAALVANVNNYGGHLDVGMIGIKYLLPALTAAGHVDVAMKIMSKTSHPSYGYMLKNGEGTLWERWEGDSHTISGSRNHIMLGTAGQWLYQGLAGISLDTSSTGSQDIAWGDIKIAPQVPMNLSGVDAMVGTVRGGVAVKWRAHAPSDSICGVGHENDDIGQPVILKSPIGGVISKIEFASYGTPTITSGCTNSSFVVNPACNAPTSFQVVSQLCVGKPACTVYANNSQFGGPDPCGGTAKLLAVRASFTGGCTPLFSINVTVPVGSRATVIIPLRFLGNQSSSNIVVVEGGASDSQQQLQQQQPVFRHGAYVPGVEGVTGASLSKSRGNWTQVDVTTGGGSYAFTASTCTPPEDPLKMLTEEQYL